MELTTVSQPYIFPGLNGPAIDFLLEQGKWFPLEIEPSGISGLVVDSEKFSKEKPYSAIVGTYIEEKALVTRPYKTLKKKKIDITLYRYKLNDDTWVWEVIDQLIADIRPALCLLNEAGEKIFRWTEEEIDDAIVFMIENDLLK